MIFYRLRASNVLVCKGGTCKLSGFGFGVDITERNLYESVSWCSLYCESFIILCLSFVRISSGVVLIPASTNIPWQHFADSIF